MAETTVSQRDFTALQADIDERVQNLTDQINTLQKKITDIQETTVVADFPDENAQIREKVLTAFSEEFAALLARLNKIEQDIIDIKDYLDI